MVRQQPPSNAIQSPQTRTRSMKNFRAHLPTTGPLKTMNFYAQVLHPAMGNRGGVELRLEPFDKFSRNSLSAALSYAWPLTRKSMICMKEEKQFLAKVRCSPCTFAASDYATTCQKFIASTCGGDRCYHTRRPKSRRKFATVSRSLQPVLKSCDGAYQTQT